MTRLSSIVLVLALTSCVAEVGAPEDVGESPEAVEPARDLPAVPAWKAYIGAPRGHQARYGAFSTRPDLVDGSAYVVLVPQADGGPAQPIPLFLRQAWRYGDLYFERLTQQMGLTPLDWIGILVAIRDLEEHPKLLPPTHALLVGPTFEEGATGPAAPPFPPLPGDDHQGPWPTKGGGQTGPSGAPTPPHPPPPRPDDTSPPPLPAVPPGWEHRAQDGIFPGDWPHLGWIPPHFPEPEGFVPVSGEEEAFFRCAGRLYVGYESGCVDFQEKTPGAKWTAKLGAWIGSKSFFGHMTASDWEVFCKFATTFVGFTSCAALLLACGAAEVVTIGGVTMPCAVVGQMLCLGHTAVDGLVIDRCGIAVRLR